MIRNTDNDQKVKYTAALSNAPGQEASGPRICVPSFRNLIKGAYWCGLYEAQDVLKETSNVDLICLEETRRLRYENWLRLPMYHGKLLSVNPGLKPVRLTQKYDLLVAIFQQYWELPYINAIESCRDHCKSSVCWIDEMWASTIPGYKHWLRALSQFDYIFVGCRGSVGPLSKAINRPCHWLPGAVDALRFSPYPNPPSRVIDVYSIGRRHEGLHRALMNRAERKKIFYVYDSFTASDAPVNNPREHRELYGNMAKRSRYFTVAPGKVDDPITGGQVEVGYRFYEGAAAGVVMIGQPPDCEAFAKLFDWPDVVVPVQPDGSDLEILLTELDSDPERVSAIGRRNAAEALLRHDWIHRWKQMFRVLGLDPPPGMARREQRLKELADLAFEPHPLSCMRASHDF